MPVPPAALSPLAQKAYPSVARLSQADEDQLLAELGLRAKALELDPSIAGEFDPALVHDTTSMGAMDALAPLGRRLLRRWSKEAHGLLCGASDADSADRESLTDALGISDQAVTAAFTALLITQIGLSPVLAPVVAALLMARFLGPSWEEICGAWGDSLADGDE